MAARQTRSRDLQEITHGDGRKASGRERQQGRSGRDAGPASLAQSFSLGTLRSIPGRAYLVAGAAALGGLLFGYDIGVISGAEQFLKSAYHLSSFTEELMVSAVLLGAILGGLVAGKMADRFSRRWTLLIMAGVYGLGAVLTSIAPGEWWFFAFRILTGVAVGASSMVVPMYIAEYSPPVIRGGLVVLQQLAISGGILVSYLIDFAYAKAGWGWRPMFATALLPAIALAVAMLSLGHSPRWLAMQGSYKEAKEELASVTPGDVDEQMAEVKQSVEESQRSSPRELLRGALRGALLAGVGLAVFQQFIGPNTVLFYTPTIFRYAGASSAANSLLSTIYVGIVLFVFVFGTIGLVDYLGRKALFYIGLGGMTTMLALMGLAFQLGVKSWGPAVLAFLLIYVACYSLSISPLFWLMSTEVFPNRLRGAGASYSTVANWTANFVVTITFLTSISQVGKAVTFWIYMLLGLLAIVFVRFFVPETKGRPLEEIEGYWENDRTWPSEQGRAGARRG